MSQPPTTTTFPRFLSLPIELRLKIWRFASHSPRYLDFFTGLRTVRPRKKVPPALLTVCGCTWKLKAAQPPALISTCRESRREVQILLRYGKPVHHYFNPDIDVIRVSDWSICLGRVLLQLERKLRVRIRRLAIVARDTSWYERHGIISKGLWDVLPTLKGLTEIQVNLAEKLPVEVVGFKEVKDLNMESGASATQGIIEKEFERIRLKEGGGGWEMPKVRRYGWFEYRELIPKTKQC
jgi:hypothetical protein